METFPIICLELSEIHNDFYVQSSNGKRELDGLSKINVFVGPNNSGKSRFLREMARIAKQKFVPNLDLTGFQSIRSDLVAQLNALIGGRITDANNLGSSPFIVGEVQAFHSGRV
jgi:hypothetical protein